MWEPEDWFGGFLIALIVSGFILLIWADTANDKRYKEQCFKAGGTPVFNGESPECFG